MYSWHRTQYSALNESIAGSTAAYGGAVIMRYAALTAWCRRNRHATSAHSALVSASITALEPCGEAVAIGRGGRPLGSTTAPRSLRSRFNPGD